MTKTACALWLSAVETARIEDVAVQVGPGEVCVRTLFSGISRGTERLVFQGKVPAGEYETMRAPFQDGGFDFPIKYGYAAVGVIEAGDRAGETVFALHPHQTRFAIPSDAAIAVPASVPVHRAVLAANMETALNILWDANVCAGDRIAVVGAGVVGALSGHLCTQMPGTEVCLIDIDPGKEALARKLGCDFAHPDNAPTEVDLVIHASATSAGLATSIAVAGVEAGIVEASWYGTHDTTIPLGGAFHRKRLRIIGSQVGRIPARNAARWTYRRRLGKALEFLADPALDALISGESTFETLGADYGDILNDPTTLCHRVRYRDP